MSHSERSLIAVGLFRNVATIVAGCDIESSTNSETGMMWIKIHKKGAHPEPFEIRYSRGMVSLAGVEQFLNRAGTSTSAEDFWAAVESLEVSATDRNAGSAPDSGEA